MESSYFKCFVMSALQKRIFFCAFPFCVFVNREGESQALDIGKNWPEVRICAYVLASVKKFLSCLAF